MRDNVERLRDVLEAIERIEKYSIRGQQAFEQDELVQIWIIHHFELIGEAIRAISPDLIAQHPEIPWPKISGMRNALIHRYFGIDLPIVWSAVESDLPDLKSKVKTILQQLEGTP